MLSDNPRRCRDLPIAIYLTVAVYLIAVLFTRQGSVAHPLTQDEDLVPIATGALRLAGWRVRVEKAWRESLEHPIGIGRNY